MSDDNDEEIKMGHATRYLKLVPTKSYMCSYVKFYYDSEIIEELSSLSHPQLHEAALQLSKGGEIFSDIYIYQTNQTNAEVVLDAQDNSAILVTSRAANSLPAQGLEGLLVHEIAHIEQSAVPFDLRKWPNIDTARAWRECDADRTGAAKIGQELYVNFLTELRQERLWEAGESVAAWQINEGKTIKQIEEICEASPKLDECDAVHLLHDNVIPGHPHQSLLERIYRIKNGLNCPGEEGYAAVPPETLEALKAALDVSSSEPDNGLSKRAAFSKPLNTTGK